MLGWEKEGLGMDGSFAAPSGVAKAGPGRARAQPKHHVCLTHVTRSRVKRT